jgi:hypothetical protein
MWCPNCERSMGKRETCEECGYEKPDGLISPTAKKREPRPPARPRPAGEPYMDPGHAERARRALAAWQRGPAALLELGRKLKEENDGTAEPE